MSYKIINSPKIKNLGVYNQAIQVTGGSLLFLSGCVSVDGDGNTVGISDAREQIRQILKNIETVLQEAGAGLDDVIKVTVFNTDLKNRKQINEIRTEFFGDHRPASTHVQVAALIDPDWIMEIDCVAVLSD